MTTASTSEKTLRRDAQRNRERIVSSARSLFARDGVDVSVDDITREAGVGMGTLYRHFPTKEELIDAVLEDAFEELVELAEQAVAAEDAWAGFAGFLEQALAQHAANRGLKDVLATQRAGRERARGDARADPAAAAADDRARAGPGHASRATSRPRTCRSCSGRAAG